MNVYQPETYGAVADGVTDCAQGINAAIAAAGADPGSVVLLGSGVYGVRSGIYQPHHMTTVRGVGGGWGSNNNGPFSQFGGTTIRALANFNMLFYIAPPPDPVHGTRLVGADVFDINFDCDLKTNFGFVAKSVVRCQFDNLTITDPIQYGAWYGVVPASDMPVKNVAGAGYSEPRDFQHNRIGKVLVSATTNGAYCHYTHGDDIANVSLNHFEELTFWHHNGPGVNIDHGDTNRFGFVSGWRTATGTGPGLILGGGVSVADYARNNKFDFVSTGHGGCRSGGGLKPAVYNRIDFYSRDMGNNPQPVIEAGSILYWV